MPKLRELSLTTISGLSHITKLAASSQDMPGRMPVTSSTGEPAGGCVEALAGQRTLPRISLATCSALAAPAGGALAGCAPLVLGVLVLWDPQAASEKRATAYVIHAKRFMMSLPTNE